jgi:hypothetical protein
MSEPARPRRGRSFSAAIACLLLGGCGDSALDLPAVLPLVWVDPARCLSPCAHETEPNLVSVDARAIVAPAGSFRVDAAAQPAFATLIANAAAAGYGLSVMSAHRTYAEQAAVWDEFSATEPGRAARPGHSEHEAGLAIDLGFDGDAAADWTLAHAWRFGLTQSYPQYHQKVTGFRYERWHYRFVGTQISTQLHARGLTLEELLQERPELGRFGDCGDCPLPGSREACGDATPAGGCSGSVLVWCFEGTRTAIDCSSSALACGPDPAGGATCRDP